MHAYAVYLKNNSFILINENIKRAIGIHVTTSLEIKHRKQHFLAKYYHFSVTDAFKFNHC